MQVFDILVSILPLLWLYALILARWERGLYWLVAYLPFAGAVSLALHLWQPSLLFKDFFFVIPLYIAFFARIAIHRASLAHFPTSVAFLMLSLALLAILQADNSGVANVMMGIIGIKVWLFYLPLCFVAYAFADSPESIVGLLRLMVALSFIPAAIALLQFGLVARFGYHSAMEMSYGESAAPTTQGFANFQVAQGSFGRIPSTFIFATQFFGYSLAMLSPSYILSRIDPSRRWRHIGTWALAAAALATVISGAREAYIFTPLTLGLMFFFDRGLRGLITALSEVTLLVWLSVTVFVGTTFWPMYDFISSLFGNYASGIALGGLVQAIQLAPMGMGTGTNTGAARYAVSDPSAFIGIENYYAKAIVELGIPGLVVVLGLFVAILFNGLKARRTMTLPVSRCCSNALLTFAIIILLNSFKGCQIDLDPVNVYYWLFAGILLKLPVLEQIGLVDNEFTKRYSAAEAFDLQPIV
jgi:hypothetical protein